MKKDGTTMPELPAHAGGMVELAESKTLAVPVAGKRYFDLGRNASYEAVKRGELPAIRIGHRLRVPVAALERMLAEAGRKND